MKLWSVFDRARKGGKREPVYNPILSWELLSGLFSKCFKIFFLRLTVPTEKNYEYEAVGKKNTVFTSGHSKL